MAGCHRRKSVSPNTRMSSDLSSVVCSAPSKVLLAGGYLVLDRENTGLVFSLDARIHVYVQRAQGRMVDSRASSPIHTQSAATKISVRSPQFVGAEWNYECVALGEDKGVQVNPINRCVELANLESNDTVLMTQMPVTNVKDATASWKAHLPMC